jgi:hypothetical protein
MESEVGRLVVGSAGGTPTEAVSSFAILLRQAYGGQEDNRAPRKSREQAAVIDLRYRGAG